MTDIEDICKLISAICVLHTIFISNGVNLEEFMEDDQDIIPHANPLNYKKEMLRVELKD